MRTTLAIDDDILDVARALAEAEGKSLGTVISELARRGLTAPRPESAAEEDGFPVFSASPGAMPITSEAVRKALEEG